MSFSSSSASLASPAGWQATSLPQHEVSAGTCMLTCVHVYGSMVLTDSHTSITLARAVPRCFSSPHVHASPCVRVSLMCGSSLFTLGRRESENRTGDEQLNGSEKKNTCYEISWRAEPVPCRVFHKSFFDFVFFFLSFRSLENIWLV